MSVTGEEPHVEVQPPRESRDRRQLFGTLLASKPARARSPLALVLSVGLHIAFVGLLVFLSQRFLPELADRMFSAPEEQALEEPQIIIPVEGGSGGERAVQERRAETEGRPDELVFVPGPITAIPEITPGPETPEPSEGAGGTGGEPRSLADRLRAPAVDARLRGGSRYALPPHASAADAVRARVGEALRAYNDSVASETEARRRALDWTVKTKDGKQWGIGPDGKIHLGDITLPAVAFTPPPGRRDEIANRNRDWAEIERQANQEIGRQSFNQRVKAIRARKEKEREEKKKTTENPPITD